MMPLTLDRPNFKLQGLQHRLAAFALVSIRRLSAGREPSTTVPTGVETAYNQEYNL
jgi:hypothetical protein